MNQESSLDIHVSRKEHLDWCKNRAMEFCDNGDTTQAYTSMVSDLQKHPDTVAHIGIQLGMVQLAMGRLSTQAEMRDFINGFN